MINLDFLNDPQREAVTTTAKDAVVLAGPGSGKTRVLVHRIAWLISRGVNPANILAVTFTNKAAGEMQERLKAMIPPHQAQKINARTFHSFGAKLLRHKMPTLLPLLTRSGTLHTSKDNHLPLRDPRLDSSFTIYDEGDQKSLLLEIIKELDLDAKKFTPGTAATAISKWKNEGMLPTDGDLLNAADEDNATRIWRDVYVVYQNRLSANNACDFDDLILYPMLLFDWDTPSLRQYQDRFRYVLIDEFQDTNGVQYRLADMLTDHAAGNLFVVGDEDQSIYGWRGADFTNVKRLMQSRPDHCLVLLEQNYRSSKTIVDAANTLICNNVQRVVKVLWTHLTGGNGQEIKVTGLPDGTAEAYRAAHIIADALDNDVPASEIALLYRTNGQSRELESALVQEGIPYRLLRGVSFYQRREVRDALAYLKFLYNGDVLAFRRIANVPKRGIGDKTVQAVEQAAGNNLLGWMSDYAVSGKITGESAAPAVWKKLAAQQGLDLAGGAAQKVWEFAQVIAYLKSIPDPTMKELLEAIIAVLKPCLAEFDNPDERVENLMELLSVAARIETTGPEALETFLESVALITDTEDPDVDEADWVTLSTLHGAKGLEWRLVILTGVEDGFCPHRRSGISDTEEERRLFYVGVTRAKEQLHVLHADNRFIWGEWESRTPSPFISEMGL